MDNIRYAYMERNGQLPLYVSRSQIAVILQTCRMTDEYYQVDNCGKQLRECYYEDKDGNIFMIAFEVQKKKGRK